MYKKAQSAFWTAEEIDLSKDMDDWVKLSENERAFVKSVLAFFAASDSIVNENLAVRFMNEIEIQEVKAFYGFQIAMENVHCVSADTFVLTDEGHIKIGSLEGKMANVWNGEAWSLVTVMKTSDEADACKVVLSNGVEIVCTPNHEWIMEDGITRKKTDDLTIGDTLVTPTYPVDLSIPDKLIFSHVEEHGRLAFLAKDEPYHPLKFNCRPRDYVPMNYCRDTQEAWLKGTGLDNTDTLVHENLDMLTSVQLMLASMGKHATLEGNTLTLVSAAPLRVTHLAVSPVRLPMYCFEEPKQHRGCFNGVITGQSETYSLLLDTYIKDPAEKTQLLTAVETVPSIRKKADWAMKWIKDAESSFAKRLVAFACVEGIFFSGAFCAIFWLKERGVMPGLCLSNEFISRDESLHTEFAIHLHSLLPAHEKADAESVRQIVTEAVAIEIEFINESISCEMLGMNADLMSTYIKFVADRLMVQLDQEKVWHVNNPFPFMERISLSQKSNFFEHTRQSDYAKTQSAQQFSLDEDF